MANKRNELEAEAVTHYVEKWGEEERAGIAKMVAKKSIKTLKAERDLRARTTYASRASDLTNNIARGCLDEGYS